MTRIRVSLALVALAFTLLASGFAPSVGAAADRPGPKAGLIESGEMSSAATTISPVRRARTRVTMYTTSGWARVTLPGVSAGHLVVTSTDNRQVIPEANGVTVVGVGGSLGKVEVDVVVEVPRDTKRVAVTVRQGAVGSTMAWVQNRTDEPTIVARASVDAASTTKSVTLRSDAFFGPTDFQLDRVVESPDDRQVLAFVYPWFDERSRTDPSLSVHPITPLLADRRADAISAAESARSNGVDGFIMSFAGGAENGLDLHQALEAGSATGGTASVLIEAQAAGHADQVEQWVREALRQSAHPAFLRHDGVPVVFMYGGFTLAPDALVTIADRMAAEGTPVHFVTDAHPARRAGILGGYRYEMLLRLDPAAPEEGLLRANLSSELFARAGATLRDQEPGLVVATVEPGYDDQALRGDQNRVVERDGTRTYDMTWQAALASQPDWVVITSWNEWYEGTSIAPSVEYGDTALDATASWSRLLADG